MTGRTGEKQEGRVFSDPALLCVDVLLPRGELLVASLFRGGAPGRVEYPVAVPEVGLERSLGDEQLLALVLHQDLAGGLEEAPRGPLRRGLDLLIGGLVGRQAGALARRLLGRGGATSTSRPLS